MSSGKDPDKCAFSYMDGIPVKISEKFKPPGKVTLPLSVQRLLNSSTTTEEYDFSLERGVLDKLEQWKKHLDTQKGERLKKIAEYENWSKMLEETMEELNIKEVAPAHAPTVCKPTVSQPTPEIEGPAVAQGTAVAPIPAKDSRYPTQPILTPVPLSYTVPAVQASHTAFNISDFEADTSSPFDNMELKTLNDMEELASVLQPASSATVSDTGYFPASTTSTYSASHQQSVATTSTYVHPIRQSSLPATFVPSSGQNLIQQLPQYDKALVGVHPHLNGYASGYSAYANVEHRPQHHPMPPCRETFPYMSVNTTHHFPYSTPVNSVIPVRTMNCSDQTIYNYNIERKPLPQNSVPQYPLNLYNFDTSKTWLGNQMYNQQMTVRPVTSSLTASEKLSITQQATHPNCPDFVQEIGQLIKNKVDTTALSPSGSSDSRHPQIKSTESDSVEQLSSLSPQAQQLVGQIAEMGFPLSKVARAYTALGDNGKTLVEYLLSMQALMERGYSEKQVEQALAVNKNDFAASELFLAAQAQLLDLGFSEDKVVDALVKFNCSRDKALEFLIT